MKNYSTEFSSVAETLHYHAALGNGYVTPLPDAQGAVIVSCLPPEADEALLDAEHQFREWHREETKEERKMLEMAESAGHTQTKEEAARLFAIKKKLSGKGVVTWRESETRKSTLVDILANHHYKSFTFIDSGNRIGADSSGTVRGLYSYYGLCELTKPGGGGQDVLIRSTSTGGAQTYSVTDRQSRMNHLAMVDVTFMEHFRKKNLRADLDSPARHKTLLVPGLPGNFSGTTPAALYALMRNVFVKGKEDADKKATVTLSADARKDWEEFAKWKLPQVLDKEHPSSTEVEAEIHALTSVKMCVAFACRVVTTFEFLRVAENNPQARISGIELGQRHLEQAKSIAKKLYYAGSNQLGVEKKAKNVSPGRKDLLSPDALQRAESAIIDLIKASDEGKVPRTVIRNEVKGVSLGLLDELVRIGKIKELVGREQCQMGNTRKAYTLPMEGEGEDEMEALANFESAEDDFHEAPGNFDEDTAYEVLTGLQDKAEAMNKKEMLPVVPLSQMSPREVAYLPKLIKQWPTILHLRGGPNNPEPKAILEDEYTPIDRQGKNLWVRRTKSGKEFCDWKVAGRLDLANKWAEEVPEENV